MNANRFKQRIAIVTGGGSGIGEAISNQLIAEGATVVVAQRSKSTLGEFIETDLANADSCEQLINSVAARFGGIDILINNAGVMQEAKAEALTVEDWEYQIRINLTAPFLLIKHALPYLKRPQQDAVASAIVNIGSIEGLAANPSHAAYCASKSGLHGLTRAIAVDHGADRVRCNAVAPGWIDTELNNDFIDAMPDPASFRQKIGDIHPLGSTGKPQDVATLVCWLASAEAAFVTGQVYTVDGGRMAKLSLPN